MSARTTALRFVITVSSALSAGCSLSGYYRANPSADATVDISDISDIGVDQPPHPMDHTDVPDVPDVPDVHDVPDVPDAACDVPAPRLLTPLSTSTVSSHRPTLSWSLPAGVTAARVELCADRGCARVVQRFDVTSSSGRCPEALAHGVYFWRVRGVRDGCAGDATSAMWELFVPVRDSPVDSFWGSVPDFDGDGLADLAVGAPGDNAVNVYRGARSGLAAEAQIIARPSTLAAAGFGSALSTAGDVNGDGYGDLLVATASTSASVTLVFGGPRGLLTSPPVAVVAPRGADGGVATEAWGHAVAAAGDLDGDGYGDFAVAGGGLVFLLAGTPGAVEALHPSLARFEAPRPVTALWAAGDSDGDRRGEVLVGCPAAQLFDPASGHVLSLVATAQLLPGRGSFGQGLAGVGDLNGDGFADGVIGAPVRLEGNAVFPVLGGASGVGLAPAAAGPGVPLAIAGVGDIDGDGFDEFAAANFGPGIARVRQLGGAPWSREIQVEGLVTSVVGVGDYNGDGFDDVAVGANGLNAATGDLANGRVSLYRGGSGAGALAPDGVRVGSATSRLGASLAGGPY